MTDPIEKILDAARRENAQTRLGSTERARMRAALIEAVRAGQHGRPLLQTAGLPFQAVPSPYQSLLRKPMPILIAIFLAVAVGGGTSYAAQGALPGDLLYPVKVDINEPVAEALAATPAAKAQLEASIAEDRLTEAQALAAKGKLASTTAAMLAADFSLHAGKAEQAAEALGKHDASAAAEINASLAARLAANQGILASLESGSSTPANVGGIIAALSAHLMAAERFGANFSATTSTEALTALAARAKGASDDATLAAQNAATYAAGNASSSAAVNFSAQASADASSSASIYQAGAAALSAGDTATASADFIKSLAYAAEAQAYAQAALRVGAVLLPHLGLPPHPEDEGSTTDMDHSNVHANAEAHSEGILNLGL